MSDSPSVFDLARTRDVQDRVVSGAFRIPGELDDGGLERLRALALVNAGAPWATAAAVYAWTKPNQGERTDLGQDCPKLTLTAFADLNLRGLSSRNTVRRYRRAWEHAVEEGWAEPAEPGSSVELPDREFEFAPRRAVTSGGGGDGEHGDGPGSDPDPPERSKADRLREDRERDAPDSSWDDWLGGEDEVEATPEKSGADLRREVDEPPARSTVLQRASEAVYRLMAFADDGYAAEAKEHFDGRGVHPQVGGDPRTGRDELLLRLGLMSAAAYDPVYERPMDAVVEKLDRAYQRFRAVLLDAGGEEEDDPGGDHGDLFDGVEEPDEDDGDDGWEEIRI